MARVINNVIIIFLLAVLGIPANAAAYWSGGITDETIVGQPYGHLTSTSTSVGSTELNLVCFDADSVWLYLDHRITNNVPAPKIVLYVDQLPPANLTFRRIGDNYTITNRGGSDFWNLIAQMAAGAVLIVDIDGIRHRYSLSGFSKAYQGNCGWVNSANNYHAYLGRYR